LLYSVSEETSTNEEENPRYRGGHIPSRVFQMLDETGTDPVLLTVVDILFAAIYQRWWVC
jgi:hypothetical protein